MEIHAPYRAGAVNGAAFDSRPAPSTPVGTDQALFASSAALESELRRVQDVRLSEVERARELVSNVHYPPEIGIQRLSTLLAIHLASES